MRMELIRCPETSVRNYRYLLRCNPEERGSQLLRGGILKLFKSALQLYFMKEFNKTAIRCVIT